MPEREATRQREAADQSAGRRLARVILTCCNGAAERDRYLTVAGTKRGETREAPEKGQFQPLAGLVPCLSMFEHWSLSLTW